MEINDSFHGQQRSRAQAWAEGQNPRRPQRQADVRAQSQAQAVADGSRGAVFLQTMFEDIGSPEDGVIDLTQCDVIAIRKLVGAIFAEAITEADLTSDWAALVWRHRQGKRCPSITATAASFLETHADLSSFLRCPTGTELLDWLASYRPEVDADTYWKRLDASLKRSSYALRVARIAAGKDRDE